jgi:hypothetical protein
LLIRFQQATEINFEKAMTPMKKVGMRPHIPKGEEKVL